MNSFKIFHRRLSGKSKVLLLVFFLMALGLVTFLVSPFILIWFDWNLAWKIGATGLCLTIFPFIAWWLIYNSYFTTVDIINNEQEEN